MLTIVQGTKLTEGSGLKTETTNG